MEKQRNYILIAAGIAFFAALCWTFSGQEMFVTPKDRERLAYTGKVKHTPRPVAPPEIIEPEELKSRIGPRPAQQITLVESPAIAHQHGGSVGRGCHRLCDPDGSCHSAEFYECLQTDPSRFGTTGRERNAYDPSFRRISYNTLTNARRK